VARGLRGEERRRRGPSPGLGPMAGDPVGEGRALLGGRTHAAHSRIPTPQPHPPACTSNPSIDSQPFPWCSAARLNTRPALSPAAATGAALAHGRSHPHHGGSHLHHGRSHLYHGRSHLHHGRSHLHDIASQRPAATTVAVVVAARACLPASGLRRIAGCGQATRTAVRMIGARPSPHNRRPPSRRPASLLRHGAATVATPRGRVGW